MDNHMLFIFIAMIMLYVKIVACCSFKTKIKHSMKLSPTSMRKLHPVIYLCVGICLVLKQHWYLFLGPWVLHPAPKIPVRWEGYPDTCGAECGGNEVQRCSGDSSKLFSLTLTYMGICLCNHACRRPRLPLKWALAKQKAYEVEMNRCNNLAVSCLESDYCL